MKHQFELLEDIVKILKRLQQKISEDDFARVTKEVIAVLNKDPFNKADCKKIHDILWEEVKKLQKVKQSIKDQDYYSRIQGLCN